MATIPDATSSDRIPDVEDATTTNRAPAAQVRLRPALDAVPASRAGKTPVVDPGVTPYKMSSNENPYPPLPSVAAEAGRVIGLANRYPDNRSTAVRERLAAKWGVSVDEVLVGTGSSGLLSDVLYATSEAGDEVVYAWRSFEAYPIMVALTGAASVQVPLTEDHRHDLDAMADAVGPNTSLVIVCNPNNPTGTVIGADDLERFLDRVPPHVLVVLDEAYLEFDRDEHSPAGLDVYRRHPNVMLMRTFSKAYGLAGMRIGYGIVRPEIAESIRKVSIPFAVTDIAQWAAAASLDAYDELVERVDTVVGERERLRDGLVSLGFEVPPSQANFLWLPLGARTPAFVEAAERAGLSLRPFGEEGVRCSVDVREANDRLLDVARAFAQESGAA